MTHAKLFSWDKMTSGLPFVDYSDQHVLFYLETNRGGKFYKELEFLRLNDEG